jgi:nickel-dependent lactate racemase
MTRIDLPYGSSVLSVDVPSENLIGVVQGLRTPAEPLATLFAAAWEEPIGMDDPLSFFSPGESVVFVVTDHTRPTPTSRLLPLLWERLRSRVAADDVTILVATGTHRSPTDVELRQMLGTSANRFRVQVHDSEGDCIEAGRTRRGNKILLNRAVVEADHLVTIGHIGMHYYAGYSGGRKNLFPGVAGTASIERNHALMHHPNCRPCVYDGNPVNDEMVEAGRRVAYRFIVDVVLGTDGRVAKVVVGEPEAAHAVGRAFWDEHFRVEIEERADLVLASAGGHPKDINLYQAHKGEYNAGLATRDGGLLYLAAACPRGVGHSVFRDWIEQSETAADVFRMDNREGFKLGGHKAVYLARDSQRIELALQSELDDELVQRFFMTPMHDPVEAVTRARRRFGDDCRILAMPRAASTLPVLPCATT